MKATGFFHLLVGVLAVAGCGAPLDGSTANGAGSSQAGITDASDATSTKARAVHAVVNFATPQPMNTTAILAPCDPTTFKSPTGLCNLTGNGAAVMTAVPGADGAQGTSVYQYGVTIDNTTGFTYAAGTETFTGEVKGCGQGAMTYTWTGFAQNGTYTKGSFTLIPELGTGALKDATGSATLSGTITPQFTDQGQWDLYLVCPNGNE